MNEWFQDIMDVCINIKEPSIPQMSRTGRRSPPSVTFTSGSCHEITRRNHCPTMKQHVYHDTHFTGRQLRRYTNRGTSHANNGRPSPPKIVQDNSQVDPPLRWNLFLAVSYLFGLSQLAIDRDSLATAL